jgi:hypothetical protein
MTRISAIACLVSGPLLLLGGGATPRPPETAAILEAVLGIWYRDSMPSQIVLERETAATELFVRPPGCPTGARHPPECTGAFLDLLPRSVLAAARNVVGPASRSWRYDEVPNGTVFLEAADYRAIFGGPALGWAEFHRRFPRARGFEQLSRPIVSRDGRDAVAQVAHRCGNLCGEGGLVWLRRSVGSDRWQVARWFREWIS